MKATKPTTAVIPPRIACLRGRSPVFHERYQSHSTHRLPRKIRGYGQPKRDKEEHHRQQIDIGALVQHISNI